MHSFRLLLPQPLRKSRAILRYKMMDPDNILLEGLYQQLAFLLPAIWSLTAVRGIISAPQLRLPQYPSAAPSAASIGCSYCSTHRLLLPQHSFRLLLPQHSFRLLLPQHSLRLLLPQHSLRLLLPQHSLPLLLPQHSLPRLLPQHSLRLLDRSIHSGCATAAFTPAARPQHSLRLLGSDTGLVTLL
jgi:hypothetical protein